MLYKSTKYDNYNFTPGHVTAIIGDNKSGKSTYVKYLMNKYYKKNIMWSNVRGYCTNIIYSNYLLKKYKTLKYLDETRKEFIYNAGFRASIPILISFQKLFLIEFKNYMKIVDIKKPEYLFLDETELILDICDHKKKTKTCKTFINLLKKVTKKNKIKTVYITHSKSIISKCDDIIHIKKQK